MSALVAIHEKQFSGKHLLHLLVAVRRFAQEQHGCGRSHNIHHADDCLMGNALAGQSSVSQENGAEQSECRRPKGEKSVCRVLLLVIIGSTRPRTSRDAAGRGKTKAPKPTPARTGSPEAGRAIPRSPPIGRGRSSLRRSRVTLLWRWGKWAILRFPCTTVSGDLVADSRRNARRAKSPSDR